MKSHDKINIMISNKGSSFIEFSLTLPILLIMFLGTIDLLTFVGANYKMEAISANIADSATTGTTTGTFLETELNNALSAQISNLNTANLYPRYTAGYVMVSDVYYNSDTTQYGNVPANQVGVAWRYCTGGGANGVAKMATPTTRITPITTTLETANDPNTPSLYSANDMKVTFNNGQVIYLKQKEQAIIVEVFGQFTAQYPFYSKFGATNIYKSTIASPNDSATPPTNLPNYPSYIGMNVSSCPN